MTPETEPESQPRAKSAAVSGETARLVAVLALNVALVLAVVVLVSRGGGSFPDLNARTLGLGCLPVSAALGLMLACRRLDFSLPVILALGLALQTPRHLFTSQPILSMAIVCGAAAVLGLTSALVTWFGRISSALWTGILGFGLLLVLRLLRIESAGPGLWPWPWAMAAAVGLLAAGAAVLGTTGLVTPPSTPPIIRSGSRGFAGLTAAWIIASVGVALASLSNAAELSAQRLLDSYPMMLAAAALGGAFILRGRWGALAAVLLTAVGHLAWSFAEHADLGNATANVLVPGLAPLVAIPLYLLIDRLIRRHTKESAPTGLLA